MYKLLSLEKAIFIINCDIFLYTTYFFAFNCLIKLCYLQKVKTVYAMDDNFKSVESVVEYSKTRHLACYADYISVAKEVMADSTKSKLKNLINFKLKKHPRYNLNDKRLKILEKIIQIRVLELLN